MTRRLIAHVDDVGMCHGANTAFLDLFGKGFVTSGSVMVPCPWFPEIAEAATARPELDLGVHLTLTSEWPGYRWRPISTTSRASGLLDDDGFMWRNVPALRAHLDPQAAEDEMRAQLERALASGIDATHLDTHMGAAAVPELLDTYLRLGVDYRLPVLLPREIASYLGSLPIGDADWAAYVEATRRPEVLPVDRFIITPCVDPAESDAVYRRMIAELPEGTTFFSLHCNAPGDIEAISPLWAPWRTDEHRLCGDPAFHRFVAEQGVELIGYRGIRDRYRSGDEFHLRPAAAVGGA
jgi:predicted glycoside hydrolase/deacetylase ChbG (UPF0249 family)